MVTSTVDVLKYYCVVLEFIVVTGTVVIGQWYSVLCGVNCGYSNSSSRAMILSLCVEFIVDSATVDVVQLYCVILEMIVVTATVDIVQSYFVVCSLV